MDETMTAGVRDILIMYILLVLGPIGWHDWWWCSKSKIDCAIYWYNAFGSVICDEQDDVFW